MIILKIGVDDKGNPVLQGLTGKINNLKKATLDAGTVMKGVFGGALAFQGLMVLQGQLSKVVEEVTKFQQTLIRIKAIDPSANIGKLTEASRQLAESSKFSQNQIANTSLELVKMGKTTEQALAMMPSVINLATASMSDLGWTTTNAVSIMNAFKIKAEDTESAVNIINAALNSSSLEMADFMEGFKYVAPIASTAGMSLKETAAVLAYFSNVGIRGSQSGTTMRTMLMNMMNGSKELTEAFKGVNVEQLTFVEIIEKLKEKGIPLQQFFKIFDKWAVTGAVALANNDGAFKELLATMDRAPAASETAQQMMNNIRDQATILQHTLYNLGIEILNAFGDTPQQAINNIKDTIHSAIGFVRENSEGFKKLGEGLVFLISNSEKLLIVFGSLWGAQMLSKLMEFEKALSLIAFNRMVGAVENTKQLDAANKRLALSVNRVQLAYAGAFAAIFILFEELLKYIDRWSEKMDKQIAKVATVGKIDKAVQEERLRDLQELRRNQVQWEEHMGATGNKNNTLAHMYKDQPAFKQFSDKYGEGELKSLLSGNNLSNAIAQTYRDLQKASGLIRDVAESTAKLLQSKPLVLGATEDKTKEKADKELDKFIKEYFEEMEKRIKRTGSVNEADKLIADLFKNSHIFEVIKGELQSSEEVQAVLDVYLDKVKSLKKANMEAIDRKWEFYTGFDAEKLTGDQFDTYKGAVGSRYLEAKKAYDRGEITYEDYTKVANDTRKMYDDLTKAEQDYTQTRIDNAYKWASQSTQITSDVMGVYSDYVQMQKTNELGALDEKMQALQAAYDRDMQNAENNTYRKAILAEEYEAKMAELQRQTEEKNKQYREKEKQAAIVTGLIDTQAAAVNALATAGDIYSGIAMALVAEGLGLARVAIISGYNYRYGGVVDGPGGGTSDSVPARLSRGERVLSNNEVDSLGGYGAIQRAVDMGSLNSSGQIQISIDTFVGTKDFVREMIPMINEELQR